MKYQFHPVAEADHLESIAYYESRSSGLGAAYLAQFEETMEYVCEAPHRHPIEAAPDIRRVGMKRFPFNIIYREKSGRVEVLAVAHHRRRPRYWLGRV